MSHAVSSGRYATVLPCCRSPKPLRNPVDSLAASVLQTSSALILQMKASVTCGWGPKPCSADCKPLNLISNLSCLPREFIENVTIGNEKRRSS